MNDKTNKKKIVKKCFKEFINILDKVKSVIKVKISYKKNILSDINSAKNMFEFDYSTLFEVARCYVRLILLHSLFLQIRTSNL